MMFKVLQLSGSIGCFLLAGIGVHTAVFQGETGKGIIAIVAGILASILVVLLCCFLKAFNMVLEKEKGNTPDAQQ